jgi:rare lipoprotein A
MFEVLALMLLSHQPLQPVAQGEASYYTVASSSLTTASGEVLDDKDLTCAMPNGEFGNYYLVMADNGKSVICRLNDRGPYVGDRVIDLSKAAMRELSPNSGTVNVSIYGLGQNVPQQFIRSPEG